MPVAEAGVAAARAEEIAEGYGCERSSLIHVLQDVQAEFDYLPRESLHAVSERLGVPLAEVLHVATFYAAFSLEPRGEHVITVCTGTACHVRGAQRLVERLSGLLGVEPGRTTADGKFTLQTVNCLGACALGPLVAVDGKYYGKMTVARMAAVVEECRAGGDAAKD